MRTFMLTEKIDTRKKNKQFDSEYSRNWFKYLVRFDAINNEKQKK